MLNIKGRPIARSSYGQQDSTEHGPTVAKAYTTYCSQPQVDGVNTYVFPTPFSLTTTTPHHMAAQPGDEGTVRHIHLRKN